MACNLKTMKLHIGVCAVIGSNMVLVPAGAALYHTNYTGTKHSTLELHYKIVHYKMVLDIRQVNPFILKKIKNK